MSSTPGPNQPIPQNPRQEAGTSLPPSTPPAGERGPRKPRRWVWPVASIAAFVVGVGIGASGPTPDVASSEEYLAVVAERDELAGSVDAALERAQAAEDRIEAAEAEASEQISEVAGRERDVSARERDLDARELDLAEREAAVTATEDQIAESRIRIGTWTVGVDIEPGTYRMVDPVLEMCYWGIYRTGTNKSDIIQNDIVQGGRPTVTLREGQDFENSCGIWEKQ